MMPRTARPTLLSLNGDGVADWLDSEGIEDGVPFLISPDGRYDIDLNAYFMLHPAPENTLAATATSRWPAIGLPQPATQAFSG